MLQHSLNLQNSWLVFFIQHLVWRISRYSNTSSSLMSEFLIIYCESVIFITTTDTTVVWVWHVFTSSMRMSFSIWVFPLVGQIVWSIYRIQSESFLLRQFALLWHRSLCSSLVTSTFSSCSIIHNRSQTGYLGLKYCRLWLIADILNVAALNISKFCRRDAYCISFKHSCLSFRLSLSETASMSCRSSK